MLANPAIYILIRVTWLSAVVFPEPVVLFVEKGFNSVDLERKGADNGDREIFSGSGPHFC
jgi:hypothetical protein